MIYSVTVTNYRNESLELNLRNPWESGLAVKNIDGLGPSKANINMTELSIVDGSVFNSARAESRNIVMDLIMLEHDNIEDSRQITYRYFPVKSRVMLKFLTDNKEVYIYGYVESNEPKIFSQMEETQISILCPDPYFRSFDDESTTLSSISGGFEFPFSNEIGENALEFGEIQEIESKNIIYTGDSSVGVKILIDCFGGVGDITVRNNTNDQTLIIDSEMISYIAGGYGLQDGDHIEISTVTGNKYAKMRREGVQYNILSAIIRGSDWLQLAIGSNMFSYSATSGAHNLSLTIVSNKIYAGI